MTPPPLLIIQQDALWSIGNKPLTVFLLKDNRYIFTHPPSNAVDDYMNENHSADGDEDEEEGSQLESQ